MTLLLISYNRHKVNGKKIHHKSATNSDLTTLRLHTLQVPYNKALEHELLPYYLISACREDTPTFLLAALAKLSLLPDKKKKKRSELIVCLLTLFLGVKYL